jgi:heparin binding hemagglutinin HbhA
MATAKFDVMTEATKGLHAGVGAADLAYETVLSYVVDAQKRIETLSKDAQEKAQKYFADFQKTVKDFDFEPQALRDQATKLVNVRVEDLSKDAATRRDLVEKRVAALQADAQKFVTANVETAFTTYGDLAQRGETVVSKLRGETAKTVAPADKKVVKRETAKKAPAKKAPAKKATAKKAPAKKAAAAK